MKETVALLHMILTTTICTLALNSNETVVVIDTLDNTIHTTVQFPEGSLPSGIAFNPDNNQLYVADFGSSAVHIIDDQTNEVVKTISVGDRPWGVAYNPVYNKIYVTNSGSGTVSVIDIQTDEVVKTISLTTAGAGRDSCTSSTTRGCS